MKNFNPQKILMAMLISITIYSCGKRYDPTPDPYGRPGPPPESNMMPVMQSISPLKALAGSVITVKGYNFNTVLSANTATVNGRPAIVNSVSNGEVLITVPSDLPVGSVGKVVLNSGTTTLTSSLDFTVTGGTVSTFISFAPMSINGFVVEENGDVFSVRSDAVLKTQLGAAVSVFAGADGIFGTITGIAKRGSDMYVADSIKHRIFTVSPTGVVSSFAGNGELGYTDGTTGLGAKVAAPAAITLDASGNLYMADEFRVRKVNTAGVMTTIAGGTNSADVNGTGAGARFGLLKSIVVDAAGNIYVADDQFRKIRKVTPAGVVTTLAGSGSGGYADGAGSEARFNSMGGMAIDAAGNIFISDSAPLTPIYRIRMINKVGVVSTLLTGASNTSVVTGPLATATVSKPGALTMDHLGNLYIYNDGTKTVTKVTFQ